MTRLVLTIVLAFIHVFPLLAAVNPPDLRCISVDNNGNVTLSWIAPNDPNGEFVRYEVYYAQNPNGPYTSFNVAGLATTTTTHTNTANLTTYYYYIQTVYNDGSGNQNSVSSDTLQTILPVFTIQTDTTATFTWNPIHTPNLPTSMGTYRVYRKIGVGAWQQVGTTTYGNEIFSDTFKVCSDSIYFKIEIDDNSGCTSTSAILEDLFQDNTAPAIPVIDSVSVDTATGNIIIGWSPSSSPDTDGYLISYFDFASSSYIIIDTVYGINTNVYIDTNADGNLRYQQYGVAAFDTCLKGNPATANTSAIGTEHRTIYTNAQLDFCNKEYLIYWTPYVGWDDINSYELYVSVNGGPDTLLSAVDTSDTSFLHTGVNPELNYCYTVKAYNDRGFSTTSNKRCISLTNVLNPEHFFIRKTTVVNSDYVAVECYIDEDIPSLYYTLERSINQNGPYLVVDQQTFTGDTILYFEDHTARVNETSYFYKVIMYDTCGLEASQSNLTKTIYASGTLNEDVLQSNLQWTAYQEWASAGSGVKRYEILRSISGRSLELVGLTSDSTFYYSELIQDFVQQGDEFCYTIKATENVGNIYGFEEESLSNEVCLTSNPKIFIPNAFAPHSAGVNRIFLPVISFGDARNFELSIYDRFGQKIYTTTNILEGWDGYVNGEMAEVGLYVYHLVVQNSYGDEIERRGTVTLLR